MKDLAKIFGYLAAVIVLGALLAPPLYWAAQALAGHGVFPALAGFKFQKFFNRAALISAVLLLWPVVRWLRIGGWRDLGVEPDPHWRMKGGLLGVAISNIGITAAFTAGFGLWTILGRGVKGASSAVVGY